MAGPSKLFDRGLLDARRRRALARRQEGADFLAHAAVDDLVDRLAAVKRSFPLCGESLDLLQRCCFCNYGMPATG